MQEISINLWAIVVAVASAFVIGGIWHSPGLFMKPWMEMARVSKSDFDAGLPKALVGDLFASFAMAFVLVHVIRYAGAIDLAQGLLVSFGSWLGFVAPVLVSSVTYEHKPLKYFAINAGYRLITMMVMGSILTVWK
jgi:hypothetical protein